VGVAFVAFRNLLGRTSQAFGAYVLGSGCLAAAAAVVFGIFMRWNVVGDAILKQPLLGYAGWASIGFGWAGLAASLVGWLVRRCFIRRRVHE
jgi:hypothetical protein